MTDHRRVLREMRDLRENELRVLRANRETCAPSERRGYAGRIRAFQEEVAALTAALEDRARLRERIEALPAQWVESNLRFGVPAGWVVEKAAVLALLDRLEREGV